MNDEPADLAAYKRELLLKSEENRRALHREAASATAALAWVPRTLGTLRLASPALLLLGPAVAFAAGRLAFGRATAAAIPKTRSGIFGKLLMAFRVFQQVKPLVDGYLKSRPPR